METIKKEGFVQIPVEIAEEEGTIYIVPKKEYSYTGFVAQGKTMEEATKQFLMYTALGVEYAQRESRNYFRRAIFISGSWKGMGSYWFIILGMSFNFRIGSRKKLKGGFFIPFTNLNISFTNYWKKSKK